MTTTTTLLTRREAWDAIYTTLIREGLVPTSIEMHSGLPHVAIQMGSDQTDDVDAARSLLGIKPAVEWPRNKERVVWSAGTSRAFFGYGSLTAVYDDPSPVLPGWEVSVYCHVHFDDSPAEPLPAETLAELEQVAAVAS